MLPEKRVELVHFQLTKNCNLRCWFCGQWGKKGFFSEANGEAMHFDDWKKVISSLVRYREETGVSPSVMLWGGEPLTYSDFASVTGLLRDNEFELEIVTNGVLIDKYADILRTEFNKIYLSVDGPREVHDSIRGKGVFDRVCKNVGLISDTRAEIIIMSVLSPALVETLENFPEAIKNLNPAKLLLQEMIYVTEKEAFEYADWLKTSFGQCALEIFSWEGRTNPEFEIKKKDAVEKILKTNYPFEIMYLPHGNACNTEFCLSPFRHIHVAWNGNVMYCTDFYDFSAGNVKKEDLTDIFLNPVSEKYRNEIAKGNCALCNHCSWRNNTNFSD